MIINNIATITYITHIMKDWAAMIIITAITAIINFILIIIVTMIITITFIITVIISMTADILSSASDSLIS